jgi:hypothetical protein
MKKTPYRMLCEMWLYAERLNRRRDSVLIANPVKVQERIKFCRGVIPQIDPEYQ